MAEPDQPLFRRAFGRRVALPYERRTAAGEALPLVERADALVWWKYKPTLGPRRESQSSCVLNTVSSADQDSTAIRKGPQPEWGSQQLAPETESW